jgi:hypothetical protein
MNHMVRIQVTLMAVSSFQAEELPAHVQVDEFPDDFELIELPQYVELDGSSHEPETGKKLHYVV